MKTNGSPQCPPLFSVRTTGFYPAALFALIMLMAGSNRAVTVNPVTGTINFNFSYPGIGYPAYGPGPGAIGSAGDVWNTESLINANNPLSLEQSGGTATTAVWSLASGGGVATTIGGTYGRLFDASAAFYSASISGLNPGQQYNFYLYSVYWSEVININGVDFSTSGINSGTVNSLSVGSQYDVHTVTADATGTLAFTPVSAQFGTPYITSWQLTPVPEPGSIQLVGVTLAAAYPFFRRRRSRAS
jgi:hypothetical protein